jgi:hypothetical protein
LAKTEETIGKTAEGFKRIGNIEEWQDYIEPKNLRKLVSMLQNDKL